MMWLGVFPLRSRKTVRYSEQIMSADKYPSIFSRQMEAIVYKVGVLRHMENSAPSLKIFRTKFSTSALYNGRNKNRRQNPV